MHFDPADGMRPAPFKHSVYNALVVPRPVGWISTISAEGVVNLAPYSFFNSLSGDPPCVMYCPNGSHIEGGVKDSLLNVEQTGEFVFNLCTWDLREQMNASSASVPRSVDEMAEAGLAAAPSIKVKPPRVAASPIQLECRRLQVIELPQGRDGTRNHVVIGQVVHIHVADEVIENGMIDIKKVRPLARLGYLSYATIDNVFEMPRPN